MGRAALLAVVAAALAAPVVAQDEKELGWFDNAELTFVTTGGNSAQSTFGLKNALDRIWENRALRFQFGGIRTESTTSTRTASGTASAFNVEETSTSDLTAENYFARGRFEQNVSAAMFVYAGAGWDRNTFAGIDNRYGFVSGVGRAWSDTETFKLRTDVGVTYTIQDDVVEDPTRNDSFAGLRAGYGLTRKLSATTDFASDLIVDENLDDTDDLRADFTNSIAVAMSGSLALKASLQLLYDKQPALEAIPLGSGSTNVFTPLGTTDRVFTLAVVLTF
jgi:putative salt-induced outer membrane protein YdiY